MQAMFYYPAVPGARDCNPARASGVQRRVLDRVAFAATALIVTGLIPAAARAGSQDGNVQAEIQVSTTSTAALIPPSHTRATAISDGAIAVDGRGDDAGWERVPFEEGFVQQEPEENHPPSERTRIKAAYDRDAIYFLFEARDSDPRAILGQLTRRDGDSASDWVHIWLDTNDDHKNAYRFSVNAAGVRQDARISDDNVEDLNWDAVWEAAAHTSTTGWSAELRIPFSQLRYDESHPRWGFQARRDVRRKNEMDYLNPVPRGDGRCVHHFGTLSGLEALPPARGITAVPYVRAAYLNESGAGSGDATVGVEGRFGLGSALSLDASINPDFGQVEADPSVLNLGATEVYFLEKRPFFLEGKEILSFGLGFGDGPLSRHTLFYSRRIGIDSAIYGSTKLTGKTTDGWAIGLLDAVTAPSDESPLANSAIARVAKDFRAGQTTVGVIGTHRVHRLDPETRPEFVRNAGSGGVDLRHKVDDYELNARFYGTYLEGSAASIAEAQQSSVHYFQRPDAKHLSFDPTRTNLSGWGLTAFAGKFTGKYWRGGLFSQVLSPGFDPNPLGYLPNSDAQRAALWFNIRSDEPNDLSRRWGINFNAWYEQTFGGEPLSIGGNINANVVLANYWQLWGGFGPNAQNLDTLALRGGPALLIPPRWETWFGFATDDREPYFFDVGGYVGARAEGSGSWWGGYIYAKVRPTSSLELSINPVFDRSINDAQYVDTTMTPMGGNIVGHLDQDVLSIAFRADWTLNPNLSVQLYVAPYFTAGTYSSFKRVVAPQAEAWADRFGPTDYAGANVFIFREMRSNLVVRWEYSLGSTVFLVWAHGQTLETEDHGSLSVARDFSDIVSSPSDDTFMVKLAYWFAL